MNLQIMGKLPCCSAPLVSAREDGCDHCNGYPLTTDSGVPTISFDTYFCILQYWVGPFSCAPSLTNCLLLCLLR